MAGTEAGWWLSIRPVYVSSLPHLTGMNVSVRGSERTWAGQQGPALFAIPVITLINGNLFTSLLVQCLLIIDLCLYVLVAYKM